MEETCSMVILSAILYFLTYHWMLATLVLLIAGVIGGGLLAKLRGNRGWHALFFPFLLFGTIDAMTGHIVNALFLNAFGTRGSAIIVHSKETNSKLNSRYIWAYDAVLKTADGRDVVTHFDTMSASIYPIRNRILIPPKNERFVAKYVPGFERNIVIMSDESDYGKRIIVEQDRGPVEKAAGQYAVSPTNPAFIKEYRDALRAFLGKHRDDADPDLVEDYEHELEKLGQTQN